jgi:hypothetical protein
MRDCKLYYYRLDGIFRTSNVRRFDSLDPRLNKAEVFSIDTDSDRTDPSILFLNSNAKDGERSLANLVQLEN